MTSRKISLAPLLLPAFALLPGCTLVVGDILADAEANIVGGVEGEGEEANEGEGEGGGTEGEGEAANDADPACEDEERLVIVRDDSVDVLQVFDLVPNRFVRRRPDGQAGNVNLDNDDPIAVGNGFGVDTFAMGSEGRLYLAGGSFLYQLDSATLSQRSIAGKPQARAGGSIYSIQVMANNVVMAGNELDLFAEGSAVGTAPSPIDGPNDDYHRTTRFTVAGEDFVAVNGRFGYVILSSTDGAPPSPTVVYDEDFTEVRFHDYGGGTFSPRGIAFDNTTKKLLLGDKGRVIVLEHAAGFRIDPVDDDGDFVLPNDSQSLVQAIATRGGFAWVLFERSNDNLMKLDLSVSPPVAVAIATVDTGGFGRDVVVGCRRVVVASFNQLIAVDRDDLSPITSLAISDLEDIAIVPRTTLGLVGDDG